MILTTLIAPTPMVGTSTYARSLLFGTTYGVAQFDSGMYFPPIKCLYVSDNYAGAVVPVASVLGGGIMGAAYSETITAQGGTPSYTFAVVSGALPTGLSMSSSGAITGTPSVIGTFSFTVTVTDSLGYTGSQAFSITIAAVASSGGAWVWSS